MIERVHNLVTPVSREEMAKIHRIAEARDLPITFVIRNLVRDAYTAQFGDEPPPPIVLRTERKAKTKTRPRK